MNSQINQIERQSLKFGFYNQTVFDNMYEEIFVNHEYAFKTETESPLIVDCGANIGLSTLYFKSQYPQSRIIAFEPDKQNIELLKHNIAINKLENIQIIEA